MDVEEAILRRRSVRSYKDRDIPREKLEKVMNSVRMAPSAGNMQDWKFVIVEDEDKRKEVYKAVNQAFVREAPAVIAGITTNPRDKMSCGIPVGFVDLSIALDHLTLKAAEEGLGTCWIGSFDQGEAKKALGVPKEYEIVALITIGYPERPLEKEDKIRKDLKDVISYDTFAE